MEFTEFRKRHLKLYNFKIDDNFLEWLVGFFEGDGSLVISTRGDIHFVLSQATLDINVLQYVKKNLGFGSVIPQSDTVSRYIVQDISNLHLICLLLNGNLVFPKRREQFKRFLTAFNKRSKEEIVFNERLTDFGLKDSWILGVTDAEGCFTVSFLSGSNAFRLRYIVSQKSRDNLIVLEKFKYLFGVGSIEKHTKEDNYSFIVSGVKNCQKIFTYFDKLKLKTKKYKSYIRFKELHEQILLGNHLDPDLRLNMIEKAKLVNAVLI